MQICGFGPSGAPHIGTLKEVLLAGERPLIFSDDMDGLRKIPPEYNYNMYSKYLDTPICDVPSQDESVSFSEFNENLLSSTLENFNINYKIVRSSYMYRSGQFNKSIAQFAEYYNQIQKYIHKKVPNNKSIFMPLVDGKYQYVSIDNLTNDGTIMWTNDFGEEIEQSIYDGNCKFQWSVDWAMRWYHFAVTKEFHGKDLIDSAAISKHICKIVGFKPPETKSYELILDDSGKKISKTSGNGTTLFDLQELYPNDTIINFCTFKPERAKNLSKESLLNHSNKSFVKALKMKDLFTEACSYDMLKKVVPELTVEEYEKCMNHPRPLPWLGMVKFEKYEQFLNNLESTESIISYLRESKHEHDWFQTIYLKILGTKEGVPVTELVEHLGSEEFKRRLLS